MVHIQNLSFGYPRKPLLFQKLNLTLSAGHIYGLLGKNGAGKSTLLKSMVGLVFPKEGSCTIQGIKTSSRSVAVLQDVYFIPEEMYLPQVSIEKYVANTAVFYPRFDETAFYSMLQEFDVSRQAILTKLSLGQQKKAIIAFGIATNTSLLIMDEPTNGLDIPSKVQFRKIMAAALTEERCMILSTHQVRDLDSLIDTVVVLHNQEVALNMNLDEIAEKVSFRTVTDTAGKQVLYAEESVQGTQVITPNLEGAYTRVDIELLFNAITGGNRSLVEHLNLTAYESAL